MRDLATDRHRDLERWAREHVVCYFARHQALDYDTGKLSLDEFAAILLLLILRAKRVASAAGPSLLTVVMSDATYGADIETAGPVLQQLESPRPFAGCPGTVHQVEVVAR